MALAETKPDYLFADKGYDSAYRCNPSMPASGDFVNRT